MNNSYNFSNINWCNLTFNRVTFKHFVTFLKKNGAYDKYRQILNAKVRNPSLRKAYIDNCKPREWIDFEGVDNSLRTKWLYEIGDFDSFLISRYYYGT